VKNINRSGGLVAASYYIADTLENNLMQPISPTEALLVATFVNVNNLEQSSTFGRIISEQIASRFAQKGYRIIEMKLRQTAVFVEEGKGEFLLSRDLRAISKEHNCPAVIVGTYAEGFRTLYVSARVVRTSDGVVIASSDYGMPIDFKAMEIILRDG
jgi:TolB-like protein